MIKYIDRTPWWGPWPFSPQCKAKKRKESKNDFGGRCELSPHGKDVDHALERGMIWVRWSDGVVRWTEPQYERVENDRTE